MATPVTSATSTENVPKDCTACRLTGAIGLVGIGAYLANIAWKCKTTPGKILISTLSLSMINTTLFNTIAFYIQLYGVDLFKYFLHAKSRHKTESKAFVTLGVQRYKNEFPFHKVNKTFKTKL